MTFHIYRDRDRSWRWALFDARNRVIAQTSIRYDERVEAIAAAIEMKRDVGTAEITFEKTRPSPRPSAFHPRSK